MHGNPQTIYKYIAKLKLITMKLYGLRASMKLKLNSYSD